MKAGNRNGDWTGDLGAWDFAIRIAVLSWSTPAPSENILKRDERSGSHF
jgi:hypothetical protein